MQWVRLCVGVVLSPQKLKQSSRSHLCQGRSEKETDAPFHKDPQTNMPFHHRKATGDRNASKPGTLHFSYRDSLSMPHLLVLAIYTQMAACCGSCSLLTTCSPLQIPRLHHSQTVVGCNPLEASTSSPDLGNGREDLIGWPRLHSEN